MSVIVATEYNSERTHHGILWARSAQTRADEKIILWEEIERLFNDFGGEIKLSLAKDCYDEEIIKCEYQDGYSYIEYKIMDGEHGR